jgi:hypothetical protein
MKSLTAAVAVVLARYTISEEATMIRRHTQQQGGSNARTIRRLGAALGVLTLVGLMAGATFAFAGSQGDQGMSAYALVDPNGGSPRLIAGHTNGFVSVSSPFAGDYCLTPAPGVDVIHTAAVASEEAFYSFDAGFPTVRYDRTHQNCSVSQLEVKTFVDHQTISLSNQIAFTVLVP